MYRLLVSLAILAVGCKHHAGPDYFGKHVQPPHGLDVLRPGMKASEARAAVPGIDEYGKVPSGADDVELEVRIDKDVVTEIGAVYRKGFKPLLTQAWGPPHPGDDPISAGESWEDPATGWRADLRGVTVYFYRIATPAFFGKAAHPFGAFATLPSTATYEQAKAMSPPLGEDMTAERFSVTVLNRGKALGSLDMALAPHVKDVLLKAWGPGFELKDPAAQRHATHAWFAPEDGWRAYLIEQGESVRLEIAPMLSSDKLLGPGPEVAVLPTPVIGKTIDEVMQAYPGATRDRDQSVTLQVAPDQWNTLWTSILMFVKDGKISSASIAFRISVPSYGDELLALFAKKWGEPKPDGAGRDLFHGTEGKLFAYPATATFMPVVEVGTDMLFLELRPLEPAKPKASSKGK